LAEVVEALCSRLTSTAVQDRVVGMSLLGHILRNLKPDFLNEKELTFIVEFLHDRLKDQHLVIPKVILSILPIVRESLYCYANDNFQGKFYLQNKRVFIQDHFRFLCSCFRFNVPIYQMVPLQNFSGNSFKRQTFNHTLNGIGELSSMSFSILLGTGWAVCLFTPACFFPPI